MAEESKRGVILSLDHLLILQHLLREPEIDTPAASRVCQRDAPQARDVLTEMERGLSYLDRGGAGRGTHWILRPEVHSRLAAPGHPERDRRIDWDAAKTRVLSVLRHRAERGEPGLRNAEIRQITHFSRHQVFRLMQELIREQSGVVLKGERKSVSYAFEQP